MEETVALYVLNFVDSFDDRFPPTATVIAFENIVGEVRPIMSGTLSYVKGYKAVTPDGWEHDGYVTYDQGAEALVEMYWKRNG